MDWSGPCGPFDAPGNVARAAPVVPRVLSPDGQAAVPLEGQIRSLLNAGGRGVVNVCGPPGSGKSVALQHLAAVLPADAPVSLVDNEEADPGTFTFDRLTLYTSEKSLAPPYVLARFEMAPWRLDDCIEYLVATHRSRCKSVIERIERYKASEDLKGLPELWRIVLDVMAADESIKDIETALRWHTGLEFPDSARRDEAGDLCVVSVTYRPDTFRLASMARSLGHAGRLLRYPAVQLPLAAESLAGQIAAGNGQRHLARGLPVELIAAVARIASTSAPIQQNLQAMIDGSERDLHATAASLLCATHPIWRPRDGSSPDLREALLAGVNWSGLCLVRADLSTANLRRSDFRETSLHELTAANADFSQANLHGAWIERANLACTNFKNAQLAKILARNCDMSGANLTGANLNQADLREGQLVGANLCKAAFRRADLRGALIDKCLLPGADFRRANLRGAQMRRLRLCDAQWTGASFRKASLTDCDLENVELPGADFRGAQLNDCLMTDSFMPGADFRRASLRGAGLAGVDWPGAVLRNADLTGATFHLGSSRSGLVGSTIPCEGSKTGFYTDDFNDQDYKSPEEIRKANLCGADLRGAKLDGVDFYLVDLRGAKYSNSQASQLAGSGAILSKHR